MKVAHFADVLFQAAGNDASKLNLPVLLEWSHSSISMTYIFLFEWCTDSYLNGINVPYLNGVQIPV